MSCMKNVTAAIIRKDETVLICRRAPGEKLAGKWEFPGGKIEPGETPEVCLRRELMEELTVDTEIGPFFMESTYQYEMGAIRLLGYECKPLSEAFSLSVHSEAVWAPIKTLLDYDFAPADIPFVKRLMEER